MLKKQVLLLVFMASILAISVHFCNPGRLVPYINIHRSTNSEEYQILSEQIDILEASHLKYKVKDKEDVIIIYIPENKIKEYNEIMDRHFAERRARERERGINPRTDQT